MHFSTTFVTLLIGQACATAINFYDVAHCDPDPPGGVRCGMAKKGVCCGVKKGKLYSSAQMTNAAPKSVFKVYSSQAGDQCGIQISKKLKNSQCFDDGIGSSITGGIFNREAGKAVQFEEVDEYFQVYNGTNYILTIASPEGDYYGTLTSTEDKIQYMLAHADSTEPWNPSTD